jgi:selenocysteine lyase/cysteine desulfurase
VDWDPIVAYERELSERFLAGLPDHQPYGRTRMDRRMPTFAFNIEGRAPREVAKRLGERGIAVWQRNFYAVEIMRRLGLEYGPSASASFDVSS